MRQFDFFIIFAPAWMLLSFFLYWPLFFKLAKGGRANKIILLRFYGAFIFGGIPLIISMVMGYSIDETLGLHFSIKDQPMLWIISFVIALLLSVFGFLFAKNPKNLKDYPQIRNSQWSVGMLVGNIVSWIVYLIGYEILFRGVLLFPLAGDLGPWPVIIIGTVLYSLSHYPKSRGEGLAAIPFGILMALLAWNTQSVWPCISIHIGLALSNSLWSLKYHPNISLLKPGNRI